MAETTTNGSNTILDLKQSFALLSVDKSGIVTMKFGDEVTVFMNDKCPAIATDLLKVIASIKTGAANDGT
ncbi:hypothetical protein FLL65_18960 [Vibrio cholerae]|uniref:hypothetical protein n=1 Tax=Vibrio cholerae TaxID=666 RepID=UPI00115BB707|nr:hypothetical protein [Vibrio cholerae]EJL6845402.1 hypothetical protein [Vibrio cholerae]TQQ43416.1 hypothetical protein FLL65_18960 [Vibrio cholerae]HEQ3484872.1 hypothetical protein [Vibrio cholerae]